MVGAAFALTAAVIPAAAFAYKGDPAVKEPNYTPERHEAMTKAFETNDYQSWKQLMDGRGVARKINAENFEVFAKAHRLAAEGNLEEAQQLRSQLGLGLRNGTGMGQGSRYGQSSR